MNLPEVVEVRIDDWDQHGFNIASALKVKFNGKTWDYFINMDNGYLKNEMKANIYSNAKLLEARYKYGLTLFALSLLKDHDEDDSDVDAEKMVMEVTKSLARVLLPVIDNLGGLEIQNDEQAIDTNEDVVDIFVQQDETGVLN